MLRRGQLVSRVRRAARSPAASEAALIYPFVICGLSIIGALLGIAFVNLARIPATRALVGGVVVNGLASALLLWPATRALFPAPVDFSGKTVDAGSLFLCVLVGIAMTFVSVWITNYFTSTAHRPVRRIAEACERGEMPADDWRTAMERLRQRLSSCPS